MGRIGVCLIVAVAAAATGCNRQDTDRLASIGKKLSARAEGVTGPLRHHVGNQFSSLGATPEGRVASRLRWDRALADASIEVRATPDAIELRGTVKNEEQRKRAVEIAESTSGVSKVSDSMQVAEQ